MLTGEVTSAGGGGGGGDGVVEDSGGGGREDGGGEDGGGGGEEDDCSADGCDTTWLAFRPDGLAKFPSNGSGADPVSA